MQFLLCFFCHSDPAQVVQASTCSLSVGTQGITVSSSSATSSSCLAASAINRDTIANFFVGAGGKNSSCSSNSVTFGTITNPSSSDSNGAVSCTSNSP